MVFPSRRCARLARGDGISFIRSRSCLFCAWATVADAFHETHRAWLLPWVALVQLYDMRSDKEERRVGGFPPEDEDENSALNFADDAAAGSSTAMVASGTLALAKTAKGGSVTVGQLGENKSAPVKEVERRLAEVELDRTLCMNRIAQLEEEVRATQQHGTRFPLRSVMIMAMNFSARPIMQRYVFLRAWGVRLACVSSTRSRSRRRTR